MKTLKIPIHSFIDVITNSSTEIYVSCDGKTEETLFSLIDSLLKVAGSDKKAKDLFDIKITKEHYDEETDEEKDIEVTFNENGYRSDDYEDDENYEQHYLELIPKDDSQKTIEMIGQIQTIFNINAQYG